MGTLTISTIPTRINTMDKSDTIQITTKFKTAIVDLKERYKFTETETNAIEFSIELYNRELARLETEAEYKGR